MPEEEPPLSKQLIREGIWRSQRLRACSKLAHLAYPFVYPVADHWGRFELDPAVIWAKTCAPRIQTEDHWTLEEVTAWLVEYEERGLLLPYTVGDSRFAVWSSFEGLPPSKRRPSTLPAPPPEIEAQVRVVVDSAEQMALPGKTPGSTPAKARSVVANARVKGEAVKAVYEHWKEVMDKPRAKLTAERERVVRARLAEGYSVEELKRAVDGCVRSDFHMGENDRGCRYDDLTLICRNGSKVEAFWEILQKRTTPRKQPTDNRPRSL